LTTSAHPTIAPPLQPAVRSASPSQREAIEADARALLVLAGPGAGKTFCLIERIRHLIETHGVDPARICAFTFTNKAAEEISHRLEDRLGAGRASLIKRGTIHAFCAELLREFGSAVALETGFGIADEEYQLAALRRIEGYRRWHKNTLNRFSAHRFRGDPLMHDDAELLDRYLRFLAERNVLDFDTLVLKAAELVERGSEGKAIRSSWDVVLVDEFQDLNPVQYRVVKALAADHRHIFAVGDDDQSIYSWAGADPTCFKHFARDFEIKKLIYLDENKRCPNEVATLARKLVTVNTPLFERRATPRAERDDVFPVATWGFENDDHEVRWLIDDVRRDRMTHGIEWGDIALLYRKHDIGERLETAFVNAGIPCRLAQGRALAEDPVIAYVIAALRVIMSRHDDIHRDAFLQLLLPRSLFDEARARAEAAGHDLFRHLKYLVAKLPRGDANAKRIRLALANWKNLEAVGQAHDNLPSLINELLSRRVGRLRSVLDDRHDEITDPAGWPEVVALSDQLSEARARGEEVTVPRMGGVGIALKGMLVAAGLKARCGDDGTFVLSPAVTPSLGVALGTFKALQLLEMRGFEATHRDFTAIDLETTGRDTDTCEIVEIAAVRVRDGQIAETFHSLVKPRIPIEPGAIETHGIRETDVATASPFEDIWPKFVAFCGRDVVIAHNGYDFDFRILARMARAIGKRFDLCTYDTLPLARDLFQTSKKLEHLAPMFGIDTGTSHRALDDTKALAQVVLKLEETKHARARKTALVNVLDNLGIALALSDDATLCDEARMLRAVTRPFALGRYTSCLDAYETEQGSDLAVPTVDEVIEALGGAELMLKIRAEKSADERYPRAMERLRRLLAAIPSEPLGDQITLFLERALLSRQQGVEPERTRVNLLTLHSTKGLEFSRVYVVGVEDSELPGGNPAKGIKPEVLEEARRLLYVGMTRTKDRLVMTRVVNRNGKETRGHQFLDEMGIIPTAPAAEMLS
jgi:DNA polymerase III epsilon subunit family exonuclease